MSLTQAVDPTLMRARARVGLTLRGKWRLDKLLGVGGMAAVYAGTHRNGSRGAIKMLHLELSLDPEVKRRFLREGYLANTVDHPGVVRVIDDDVADDGAVFIVMELLQGETLDARWERFGRRLPPEEVLSAIDPILSVLVSAHEKSIVHRDIKPENIFVCHDGSMKLLDFGIARLRESSATATRSGSAMGTPSFMPPEQALGRMSEVGACSDIWAIGASMFTLLSGQFVHDGRTANEQLVAAATRQAPPLASVLPDAHPALAQLVDRALAFDAAARWPDAATMQNALRDAYHAIAGSPVQTAPRLAVPVRNASSPDALAKPTTATTGAAAAGEKSVTAAAGNRPRGFRIGVLFGAIALFLGGVGVAIIGTRVARPNAAEEPAPARAQGPSATTQAPESAPAETPVSPSAPTAAASAPAPTGQIRFVVRGGACAISVDDASFDGPPADAVDVSVGVHVVTCRPPKGSPIKQSVRVAESKEKVVTFSLSAAGPPLTARERRK